jgi:hypothetical protein
MLTSLGKTLTLLDAFAPGSSAFEKTVSDPDYRAALTRAGFEPRLLVPQAAREMWEGDFKIVEEVLSAIGQKK